MTIKLSDHFSYGRLLRFTLPSIAMMIFTSIYGVVDGFFFSGFFTALNDGLTSALISFLRTLVFQVGAVLLLPLIWGIDGVWVSIVVADMMAVMLGSAFLIMKQKKYKY